MSIAAVDAGDDVDDAIIEIEPDNISGLFFDVASLLTDPVCYAHQLARRAHTVKELHPDASSAEQIARQFFFLASAAVCACLAIVTTIPGIILRELGIAVQNKNFRYYESNAEEKTLINELKIASWNVGILASGHVITDAGVTPWQDGRGDKVLEKIKDKDADVVVLFEMFDPAAAKHFIKGLEETYKYFIYNPGSKAVGPNSGIFVASKSRILNPQYTPFSADMLDGRAKGGARGLLEFNLSKRVRIFASHLQHSEIPAYPTLGEIKARRKEMDFIVDRTEAFKVRNNIFTADANMNEEEWHTWADLFVRDPNVVGKKTWGGDDWCARAVNRPKISGPLCLDYTGIFQDATVDPELIQTTLIETGFEPTRYLPSALSDHKGLFSRIKLL